MRARSCLTASRRRSSTARWFFCDSMSMKSMTIRPPTSRSRIWRAISSAASRLVLSAVVSMSVPRVLRAELMSIETSASVWSITMRAARGQRHLVAVGGLDLALDLVPREQRHVVVVELEPAQVVRHEALHVLARFLEHLRLVDQDLADVVGEVVAQRPQDRGAFPVDQERRGTAVGGGLDRIPDVDQVVEVPLQLLGGAADARPCGRWRPCRRGSAASPWPRAAARGRRPRSGARRRPRAGCSASAPGTGPPG